MDDIEYRKLVDLSIKLRTLEGMLTEALTEVKAANEVVRELILRYNNNV